jgi:glutaredoxin
MSDKYTVGEGTRPRRNSQQEARRDRLARWITWIAIACAGFFLLRSSDRTIDVFASDAERQQFDVRIGNHAHVPTLVLVTEWCPACKSLQHALDNQRVPYVALDVEHDQAGGELFSRCVSEGASQSIPKVIYGLQMIPQGKLFSVVQQSDLLPSP